MALRSANVHLLLGPPVKKNGSASAAQGSEVAGIKVREMTHFEREAKASGKEVHFGRVHELCFEKNPDLAPDNPARKFKGRVVFLGNQVRDQNWEMAMFQEPLPQWVPPRRAIALPFLLAMPVGKPTPRPPTLRRS